MKTLVSKIKDLFSVKELQGLDVNELLMAFNDASVRKQWMFELCEDIKRMNLDVDARLLSGKPINDLAARRKAYQDVLESVLAARRRIQKNPNPKSGSFDLDSVTVQSVE